MLDLLAGLIPSRQLLFALIAIVAVYGAWTKVYSDYMQMLGNKSEDRMLKTIETAASSIEKLGFDSTVALRLHDYIESELLPELELKRLKANARRNAIQQIRAWAYKIGPRGARNFAVIVLFWASINTVATAIRMRLNVWQTLDLMLSNVIAYGSTIALLALLAAPVVLGMGAIAWKINCAIERRRASKHYQNVRSANAREHDEMPDINPTP